MAVGLHRQNFPICLRTRQGLCLGQCLWCHGLWCLGPCLLWQGLCLLSLQICCLDPTFLVIPPHPRVLTLLLKDCQRLAIRNFSNDLRLRAQRVLENNLGMPLCLPCHCLHAQGCSLLSRQARRCSQLSHKPHLLLLQVGQGCSQLGHKPHLSHLPHRGAARSLQVFRLGPALAVIPPDLDVLTIFLQNCQRLAIRNFSNDLRLRVG